MGVWESIYRNVLDIAAGENEGCVGNVGEFEVAVYWELIRL